MLLCFAGVRNTNVAFHCELFPHMSPANKSSEFLGKEPRKLNPMILEVPEIGTDSGGGHERQQDGGGFNQWESLRDRGERSDGKFQRQLHEWWYDEANGRK